VGSPTHLGIWVSGAGVEERLARVEGAGAGRQEAEPYRGRREGLEGGPAIPRRQDRPKPQVDPGNPDPHVDNHNTNDSLQMIGATYTHAFSPTYNHNSLLLCFGSFQEDRRENSAKTQPWKS